MEEHDIARRNLVKFADGRGYKNLKPRPFDQFLQIIDHLAFANVLAYYMFTRELSNMKCHVTYA